MRRAVPLPPRIHWAALLPPEELLADADRVNPGTFEAYLGRLRDAVRARCPEDVREVEHALRRGREALIDSVARRAAHGHAFYRWEGGAPAVHLLGEGGAGTACGADGEATPAPRLVTCPACRESRALEELLRLTG